MTQCFCINEISVDPELAAFFENEVLLGSGVLVSDFWSVLSMLLNIFGPENSVLLAERDCLQILIDDWYIVHCDQLHDAEVYQAFLCEIGYLLLEGKDFIIEISGVDFEIAVVLGLQLVVLVMNA